MLGRQQYRNSSRGTGKEASADMAIDQWQQVRPIAKDDMLDC